MADMVMCVSSTSGSIALNKRAAKYIRFDRLHIASDTHSILGSESCETSEARKAGR